MKTGKKMQKRLALFLATLTMAVAWVGAMTPVQALASDKEVETRYLGDPKYAYWESDTVAKWTSVSKAHEYQVRLYIADYVDLDDEEDAENRKGLSNSKLEELTAESECVTMKRTTQQRYDFSEYMNDKHSYFFAVRAVPKTSEQAWVVAGDWVASPIVDFTESAVQGITGGIWRNYLNGSKYQDQDGEYLGAGWNLIQGSWYLMDEEGYRLTGFQTVDGETYYLSDDDGRLATGWFVWNENWYYSDDDGKVQTGWIMDLPGKYYYLNEDGTLATNTTVDGYYVNDSGLRQSVVSGTED
ncbi:MAG: hypothetical protein LUE86_12640 [Clostridiales bacterium]|nr:hypothetical protein [Clostridiales bacterium]